MPQAIPHLETSFQSGVYSIEGKKDRPMGKLRCVFRECPTFRAIWLTKTRADSSFTLQSIADEDHGQLVYRGKRFNRDSWTWQPPKLIWSQGRRAHEPPNPANAKPLILQEVLKNGVIKLEAVTRCTCGGQILKDSYHGEMYCAECGLIYEDVIWFEEVSNLRPEGRSNSPV